MEKNLRRTTGVPEFEYGRLDDPDREFVRNATSEIRRLGKQIAENIIAIGSYVSEVKERLPWGTYGAWLADEFGWSASSADNFVNCYQLTNSPTVGDLPAFMQLLEQRPSTAYAIAAPSTPEPVRQEVLAETKAGRKVTTAQVRSKKAARTGRTVTTSRRQPEPVEGVDYEVYEDKYGFKHRRPITKPETPSAQPELANWLRATPLDEIAVVLIDAVELTRLQEILAAIDSELAARREPIADIEPDAEPADDAEPGADAGADAEPADVEPEANGADRREQMRAYLGAFRGPAAGRAGRRAGGRPMTRRHVGKAATVTRSSGRPRLVQRRLETKSAPVGWDRPPCRPLSMCRRCWADLSHLAWVDGCPACKVELRRD